MKTKRKAAASSYKSNRSAKTKSYGVGGAVMTLGKNLLQGKKLGSGALKGVLRAGITPGSGVGAGLGMAGALAGKSKKPWLQKVGKGLGVAGSVAGLFTGGGAGGAGALGGLAGKFQNFMPGTSGANGMRVRKFEDGGVVEKEPPSVNSLLEALGTDDERGLNQLLNQQYREDMKRLEQEGNEELSAERNENRGERRRVNQEYREDLRSDDLGEEELETEGEGGIDKEQLNKILKALAAGGVGFGAMVGMPKLVNLLKKAKDPINSDELYHNVDDPMPADPGPYKFRNPFNQSSGGRRQ